MVERKEYLQKLWSWKDEQVIKVVTGIRRCGKSTLLKQYQNKLKSAGVTEEQIISINFEELENEPLLDYKSLYQYIKERLCEDKMTYIFLDEIQKVTSFEKVVDSLHVKENIDIYIIPDQSNLDMYRKGNYIMHQDIMPKSSDILPMGLILFLVTGIGICFQHLGFTDSNIITLYILGVLLTALICTNYPRLTLPREHSNATTKAYAKSRPKTHRAHILSSTTTDYA